MSDRGRRVSGYLVERAVTLSAQHEATIAEVDAALNRMEAGCYGYSEISGEQIEYERLKVIPWARTGVSDQ